MAKSEPNVFLFVFLEVKIRRKSWVLSEGGYKFQAYTVPHILYIQLYIHSTYTVNVMEHWYSAEAVILNKVQWSWGALGVIVLYFMISKIKTSLPAQNMSCHVYLIPVMWGGYFTFAPPLHYLWSSSCVVHLITSYRWTAVYPNSFLPSNFGTGL